MSTPTYIANLNDKGQTDREVAQFEGGIPVFDGVTKVIMKGNHGSSERTMHAVGGNNIGRNAGVVMPHDAKPGLFVGDVQGRK